MEKYLKKFQIKDLLKITKDKKYAATVAAFEIIENLDKLELLNQKELSNWKTEKSAVKAMLALASNLIQYDFISLEEKLKLEENLKKNIHLKKAEALFSKKKQITEDSEEDLSDEEVGEIHQESFHSNGFTNSENDTDVDIIENIIESEEDQTDDFDLDSLDKD